MSNLTKISIKSLYLNFIFKGFVADIFIAYKGLKVSFDRQLYHYTSECRLLAYSFFISHQEESSKSRQIIKNALSGGAKAIFQGKIYVSSVAQKTDGYQMSNGLILTDDCQFLVKPELEIYADDVICSHGSISGTLNSDHLFYLQSRGIPLVEAQKLLIQAFFAEILNEINDEKLINLIQNQISIKLA